VRIAGALAVTLVLCTTAGLSAGVLGTVGAGPAPLPLGTALEATSIRSDTWAGYAATGPNGSAVRVDAKWVEPNATCGSTTSLAAFWVGLDGFQSSTVEQTGTLTECQNGTASSYAWWEMYPLNSVQLLGPVRPGDSLNASVTYSAAHAHFTLRLTDVTTQVAYTITRSNPNASESSAECIVEAPSGGAGTYPLADFGSMHFASCTVSLGGATHGIGLFSTVAAITMVSATSPGRTLASVSGLRHDTGFTVTWRHSR
jgi:hypothetical protein